MRVLVLASSSVVDLSVPCLQVDVITLGPSITLVPRTAIPIDRSRCPGYTPHPIPSHSHTSPAHMHTHIPPHFPHTSPPTPTQTPLPMPPCPAMDNMARFFRTYLSCEISATCDQLNCSDTKGSGVAVMLLPCYIPPAFKMIFAGEGNFLWEHIFTHTEQVPYIMNITLNATLNHISAGVIGVQVCQSHSYFICVQLVQKTTLYIGTPLN